MILFDVPWAWCECDGIKPEVMEWFIRNPVVHKVIATDWDFYIEFQDPQDLMRFKLAQTLSTVEPDNVTQGKQIARLFTIEIQREIDLDIIRVLAGNTNDTN